jgi:hypothetical protein
MFEFDIANPSVRAAAARERVLDDLSRDHPFDHSVNRVKTIRAQLAETRSTASLKML